LENIYFVISLVDASVKQYFLGWGVLFCEMPKWSLVKSNEGWNNRFLSCFFAGYFIIPTFSYLRSYLNVCINCKLTHSLSQTVKHSLAKYTISYSYPFKQASSTIVWIIRHFFVKYWKCVIVCCCTQLMYVCRVDVW
jgi:hypothetical protein